MHNDNVYPLNGQAYRPGLSALEEKRVRSEGEVIEQLPIIKKVAERLDERIKATDSVKKALEIAETYKVSEKEALAVMDIVRQQLEDDRRYISTQIKNLR